MKATESRSPHKYSPVLVGRGCRYRAVGLGGGCPLQVTRVSSDGKGSFC